MKKNLLLTLALGAMGLTANAATHNIYVANLTDWGNDVTLYSWGSDAAGKNVEILGGWPGAAATAQETISNVKYDKFVIEGHDGETANLIFNNNADEGQQVNLATVTLTEANYYFATNGILVNSYDDPANPDVDFDMPETFVYVLDKTGWSGLYVYGWATGEAEVFGGWPGAAPTEEVTIAGETFKKVPFPGTGEITYNLIFNNNNDDEKVEGISAPSGKDVYVEVTATECKVIPKPGVTTYNIYIEDKTGWDKLYLYAYVGAQPSIFGGWPGVELTEKETVDGVEYKVVKDVEATDVEQTFIINNNDGDQVDVPGAYAVDKNLFFTATANNVGSGVSMVMEDNAPVEYFNLQGVRIAEPSNGIYILRKGSKVSKIVK
ncbi:starch-binding protein [bacterium]|nr:starch-binding protein [bacterium]